MKNIFDMKVTKEEFRRLYRGDKEYAEAVGLELEEFKRLYGEDVIEFDKESYLTRVEELGLIKDVVDLHILRGELDAANKVLDKHPRLRQDLYPEGVEWVAYTMGVVKTLPVTKGTTKKVSNK